MKIQWSAGIAFIGFMVLAVITAKMLNLQGTDLTLFLTLLGVLGLSATAFFVYFQTKYKERREGAAAGAGGGAVAAPAAGGAPGPAGGGAPAPAGGGGELEALLREADSRLSASKAAGGANLSGLPVVLVVGDRSSAKTSTVIQSGLEPELLAGHVHQDNTVTPTRSINAWFARNVGFVEAGGPLLADPSAWVRLVRKLQPGKLRSPAGKGRQSPRAVLVCFDGESFLRQGANEAVPAAARYLQARFGEISQTLGISFPVYVLFTKMDRVPFFSDYVRNLSNEEAMQVVGVTLPIRTQRSGVYAQEETERLTTCFNNLFYSLCDKRLLYMPRETDPEKLPGAYEFPREFRKLRTSMIQMLVDICRPSQLRASPFLRGFYFSGVRPVVVSDVAASPVAPTRPATQTSDPFGGATGIFRAGKQQEMIAQQAVAQQQTTGRKVPQWMFIGNLFNGILLQDHVAMGASGSSVKKSFLKRVIYSTVAGLCLLYSIALIVSYFGNRALEDKAITAAHNISAAEAQGTNLPSQDSLQRLETLRQSLEQLTEYETDGAPLHLRWGLYTGSAIYPSVRRIYYNKFSQLLFGSTQAGLLAFLQRVPASPGPSDDYGFAYNTLKGYLLTTSEYKRSSDKSLQQFLALLLLDRWSAGRDADIGPDRKNLAKLQFDFYSRDLANGNPFSAEGDGPGVEHARQYLAKFSGVENIYQGLLAEAAKVKPAVSFNQAFPGTSEVVTSMQPVHYAFTKDGWDFVQKAMKKPNVGGEQWVLGTYTAANVDREALAKGVLERYTRDYINQWRAVLRTSKVNPYSNLKDAASKLNKLTSTQTPLLGLFWWVSQNTGIGLPAVSDAFKAVQQVVPVSPTQQYIVANNQSYVNALLKLQQTIDQAANQPAPDPNAAKATRDDAAAARLVTKQLSNTFPIDREGHIETVSENLLMEPITNAEGLSRAMGIGDVNAKGAGFCTAFNGMTRKFPFNPTAREEASLTEVSDLLKPKDGKLWVFYDGSLKNFISCQGSQCEANPNSPAPVNPAFVRFIGQVVAFSHALYGDNGTDPNYKYSLKPQRSDLVESFDIRVNDQEAKLTGGQQHPYVWPGPGNRDFRLSVKVTGGSSLDVQTYDGLWAVFRFFADADRSSSSGSGSTFSWVVRSGRANSTTMINGKPLAYQFDVDTGGAPAIFSKDFLAGLKCVSTVAH